MMRIDMFDRYRYREYPTYSNVPTGAAKEKQKRKEGDTCPMPKPHNRFPRKK